MSKWLTQNEVLEILHEFPTSHCDRFELTMGSIHIMLNRVHETLKGKQVAVVPSGKSVSVDSPSVGIFCAAPEQAAPPFVKPGDRVSEDTIVGLIKVLQEIKWVQAKVGGTIVDICAQDGQFVEFGQTLFHIQTDGGVNL